jgi:hypothetical protein
MVTNLLNRSVMAKQEFSISGDMRFGGKVVKDGTKFDLDPSDPDDAKQLGALRATGRLIGDVGEAPGYGHVSGCGEAAPEATPEAKPEVKESPKPETKKSKAQ